MTTDATMQGMATSSNNHAEDLTDAWRSVGSTTSLNTMDNEDDERDDELEESGGRRYEPKTRRFAWPDDLHRLFVAAIFDLGLKNASPKALLPFMEPTATNAGLTTEHLKSHLQKYRLNYEKSRSEFLAFFDESARRNGRRRRRTSKSMESHTRFIFPITPCPPEAMNGPPPETSTQPANVGSPQPSALAYSQLSPRTRQDRANLLRLAQQNAAMALATQYAGGDAPPGSGGVSDAQWGMLASLLSPPVAAAAASSPADLSLNDDAVPDMQLQMHLAMQAQMNLHRQMLDRKVAVSQHYYNQAAAAKRALAERMMHHPQAGAYGGRYSNDLSRYPDPSMAPPPSRPSIGESGLPQQYYQSMHYPPQQQRPQQPQPRYATSSQADALLGPPWDAMDVDMSLQAEDQSDLFSFLKTSE